MTVLVTGGSGSGKSALAEQISERLRQPEKPLYYLATMQVWDAECEARIAKHRQQRAGKGFCTIEMPDHAEEAAASLTPGSTALLECVSNLTANEQFGTGVPDPAQTVLDGIGAIQKRLAHLVIVTNEVFSAGTPADAAMQTYLQNLGKINCTLAQWADVVLEVSCGVPIVWKGEKCYREILV